MLICVLSSAQHDRYDESRPTPRYQASGGADTSMHAAFDSMKPRSAPADVAGRAMSRPHTPRSSTQEQTAASAQRAGKAAHHVPRKDNHAHGEDGKDWSHILSWEVLNKGIAPHIQGRPSDKDHAGITEMMNHSQNGRIKARQGTKFSNINDATHTAAQNASTDTSLDKEITAACHGGGVLTRDAAARANRQFAFVSKFLADNPGKVSERWVGAFFKAYGHLKDQDGKPLFSPKAVAQATGHGTPEPNGGSHGQHAKSQSRSHHGGNHRATTPRPAAQTGLRRDGAPDMRTTLGRALATAQPHTPPRPVHTAPSFSSPEYKTPSQPRALNTWNAFTHSHAGKGLSMPQLSGMYHTPHNSGVGGGGGGGGWSGGGGGSSGGGGLGWNAFQSSVGGQGYSRAEISSMYHAQK
jgi:hypothetical protein